MRQEPLEVRIFDTASNRSISRDELIERVAGSRFLILGEVHDNAIHHRLQAEIFQAIVRTGRVPALAMEQFDREHQASLDAARARGERDAERMAQAGAFDRKGWRWPDYKPLVEIALASGAPILAANFSRADARALMSSEKTADGLAVLDPAFRAVLEKDIVEGHCGIRPSPPVLAGMIEAQRARDAAMAQVLGNAGPAGGILIAGSGHARRDRGVPAYLPAALRRDLVSVAFVEVPAPGNAAPAGLAGMFDYVWFTPRAARADPCKDLRLR